MQSLPSGLKAQHRILGLSTSGQSNRNDGGDGVGPTGVGIYVTSYGHKIVVNSITRGGAAQLDGRIKQGDVLVKVDGYDCEAMTLAEVRHLIQGPPGTYVDLVLYRQGLDENTEDDDHEDSQAHAIKIALLRGTPMQEELIRLRGAQDSMNRELFRLRTQLQQQSAAAQEANDELSMTLTRLSDLEAQNASLRSRFEDDKRLIQNLEKEAAKIGNDLDNTSHQLAIARSQLSDTENINRDQREQLSLEQQRIRTLEGQLVIANGTLAKAKDDASRNEKDYQHEIRVLKTQLDEERKFSDRAHQTVALHEQDMQRLKATCAELGRELEGSQEKVSSSLRVRRILEDNNAKLQDEVVALQTKIVALEKEKHKSEHKAIAMEESLHRSDEMTSIAKARLLEVRKQLDTEQDRIISLERGFESERVALEQQIKQQQAERRDELRAERAALITCERDYEDRLRASASKLAQIKSQLEQAESQLDVVNSKLRASEGRCEDLTDLWKQAQAESAVARQECHALESRVLIVEDERYAALQHALAAEGDATQLKRRCDESENAVSELRTEMQHLRKHYEQLLSAEENRVVTLENARNQAQEALVHSQEQLRRLQQVDQERVMREEDYLRRHFETAEKIHDAVFHHSQLTNLISMMRPMSELDGPNQTALSLRRSDLRSTINGNSSLSQSPPITTNRTTSSLQNMMPSSLLNPAADVSNGKPTRASYGDIPTTVPTSLLQQTPNGAANSQNISGSSPVDVPSMPSS